MNIEKPRYNYSINGFRGLCILMVFIYHIENSKIIPWVQSWGALWPALLFFLSSFRYGVEAFFMISGYVIVGSLRRHATAGAFFTDRALRIYPAWIPLHLLIFIFGPLLARNFFGHLDAMHWIACFFVDLLFLTPAIVPVAFAHPAAWSLSYEWLFYLLAAATAVLARGRMGKYAATFIVAAASLALINLYPRGLFFVPGVLVALNEGQIKNRSHFFRFPVIALLVFLLSWRSTGADRAELDTLLVEWFHDSRIFYAALAFCAGSHLFACITLGTGWLGKKLHTPFMQFFGKISYSFYLWSPIVMFPVKRLAVGFIAPVAGTWGAVVFFAALSFLLSTLVSWLSWHYIEKRLTNVIRQRLGTRKQSQRMETAGA